MKLSLQKWVVPGVFFGLIFLAGCKGNLMFKTTQKTDLNGKAVQVINPKPTTEAGMLNQVIKVDDQIAVKHLNNFEISTANADNEPVSQDQNVELYLVGQDSLITLPLIGRVNLVGLSKREAALKLEELYSEYILNAIIDVDIISASVDILGEVNRPGNYKLVQKNTTLTDILAVAGGISDYANNRQIKIVRGDRRDPEIIIADLTQIESLGSGALYLQDGDLIYVEPTTSGIFDRKFRPYTPVIALLNVIATTVLIIYRTK